jgi:hypothetical protein
MKALFAIVLAAGTLTFVPAACAQTGGTANNTGAAAPDTKNTGTGCAGCAQKTPADAVTTQLVPGTNEAMLVGRIENLIPIGVVAVLGCETCAGEAVTRALQQGSSTEDVERTLRTIAAMQKLDCFKHRFGPDAAARLEKPLTAARRVLQQAMDRAGRAGK